MTDRDDAPRIGIRIAILGGYNPARTAQLIRRLERVAEIQAERLSVFEIRGTSLAASDYLPRHLTAWDGKGNGGGRRRGQRKGSNPWE